MAGMNTLRAATLSIVFALALGGVALCADLSPAPYQVLGYTFEPSSGNLFMADGVKLPFTFEYTVVKGHDARGNETEQRMSPLQYATRDTAEKVLKFVQGLVGVKAEAWQDNPYGPYTFTSPQRSVLVDGTIKLNAGLIACEIMIAGEGKTAALVLLEIQRARIERAKRDAE